MSDGSETMTLSAPAVATAEWWAGHVFGGTVGNSGDGGTMALAVLAGAQGRPAAAEKRAAFVQEVARTLDANDCGSGVTLSTDYGPEDALARIAAVVGIGGGSFPWKSMTRTCSTHVTAALGYGASAQLIWQAPDWERPTCGLGKYGDRDREPWKCSAPRYHEGGHVFDTPDPLCVTCGRPAGGDAHERPDGTLRRWAHIFFADTE